MLWSAAIFVWQFNNDSIVFQVESYLVWFSCPVVSGQVWWRGRNDPWPTQQLPAKQIRKKYIIGQIWKQEMLWSVAYLFGNAIMMAKSSLALYGLVVLVWTARYSDKAMMAPSEADLQEMQWSVAYLFGNSAQLSLALYGLVVQMWMAKYDSEAVNDHGGVGWYLQSGYARIVESTIKKLCGPQPPLHRCWHHQQLTICCEIWQWNSLLDGTWINGASSILLLAYIHQMR